MHLNQTEVIPLTAMTHSKDRFQLYQRILGERPEYLTAIRKTEESIRPEFDTRLYLYTMAPALTEFVNWVLDEAVRTGKKRLYFLSRDGYQMYLTACKLTKLRELEVECRYLHVSRYSMRVPSYHLELGNCLDLICVGGIDVTLEKILRRADLTEAETSDVVSSIGWENRFRNILNYRQILELKQTLMCQEKLLDYIEQHSRAEYDNAMGYLTQEGLLSEEPYAIVDSGWVGTLQKSVETLVHSKKPDIRVEGYYFGLYELPQKADIHAYHAWYFTPGSGLQRKACFSNSLFETICSAEEGMTLGYYFDKGKFVPRMEQTGNPNSAQMRRNMEALEVFLEYYCVQGAHASQERISSLRLVQRLFDAFMASPTETELEAYGDNLFSDDLLGRSLKKTAAELTHEQICDQRFFSKLLILSGIKKADIRESAWIEGSIVRCGRNRKSSLRHARFYKYFVYARKQIRSGKK